MLACLLVNVILLTDLLASTEDGDETDDGDNIGNYDYQLQTRWTPKMDLFCSKVTQRVEDEHHDSLLPHLSSKSVQITSLNVLSHLQRQSAEIPYRYSLWRSSPDLPRRLTPCDHQLFMELLSTLDQVFRQHSIPYMMMDGTLLGNETRHSREISSVLI